MKTTLKSLSKNYEAFKEQVSSDAKNPEISKSVANLTKISTDFLLSRCNQVPLISKVPNKKYFSFSIRGKAKLSRAINKDLFDFDYGVNLTHFIEGNLDQMPMKKRTTFLYTIAMAYCCTTDLLKDGDQKTPATFFEGLIGHLFAVTFGVNPMTQIEVLGLREEKGSLPTDFIFDLGQGRPKFHVPVKTSTRERVIQVFAHQRVLDGVHGFGTYSGVLVCLAETKLDHKKREVIEICVPRQWSLYQRFIAPLQRIYYFDIPKKYAELAHGNPPMPVKSFAVFFDESNVLASGK